MIMGIEWVGAPARRKSTVSVVRPEFVRQHDRSFRSIFSFYGSRPQMHGPQVPTPIPVAGLALLPRNVRD
jgi:hypothetical protein